jgi:hypothetical protein
MLLNQYYIQFDRNSLCTIFNVFIGAHNSNLLSQLFVYVNVMFASHCLNFSLKLNFLPIINKFLHKKY